LTIPDNPKDLAFLEGCWTTAKGHTTGTGRSASARICFDKRGRGNSVLDHLGGNGQVVDTCRGTATASIRGGKVVISQSRSRCGDGTRYGGATVWCEPVPAGAARCEGRNEGSREMVSVPLYYKGPR
jgi:hypothetical protein